MWRLATRNWSENRGRTAASAISVAIGVITIVLVGAFHDTGRRILSEEIFHRFLGSAHLSLQATGGHWGTLDEKLVVPLQGVPGVAAVIPRLQRRMALFSEAQTQDLLGSEGIWVDAIGIPPGQTPAAMRNLKGRSFTPEDEAVAILEKSIARDFDILPGGLAAIATHRSEQMFPVTVVGVFEHERLGEFQRPTVYVPLAHLQKIRGEVGKLTSIDIVLAHATDASAEAVEKAIGAILEQSGLSGQARVESFSAARNLLDQLNRIARLTMILVTFAAMATAFFIIATTMGMSLFARRLVLGTLRCVGMTRGQLVTLLLVEIVPVGIAGTLMGLGAGFWLARQIPGWWGAQGVVVTIGSGVLAYAVLGGLGATLGSCVALLGRVLRASPLTASLPDAKPAKLSMIGASFVLGGALIALHEYAIRTVAPDQWLSGLVAIPAAGALYLGYIFLVPGVLIAAAPPAARILSVVFRLPKGMVSRQILQSPWRASGICWVMLVGISLIVYSAMNAQAARGLWNFAGTLPDIFLYTTTPLPQSDMEKLTSFPRLSNAVTVTDVNCELEPVLKSVGDESTAGRRSFLSGLLKRLTRPVFIAGDPRRLMDFVKVTFIEGSADEAFRKMDRGGYILVPVQTATNYGLHVGDTVVIRANSKAAEFEVAGVIQSPPLDFVVTAFQATSYYQFAAASAVIGTRADLQSRLGIDAVSLLLADYHIESAKPPPSFEEATPPPFHQDRKIVEHLLEWAPSLPEEAGNLALHKEALLRWLSEAGEAALPDEHRALVRRYGRATQALHWNWTRRTPQERWTRFRERLFLLLLSSELKRPDAIVGSLRTLKQEADRIIARGTSLATWLPSVLLAVAGLGAANLVLVSVRVRAREFAILRAMGAARSQIARIVLVECAAIGIAGCAAGVGLGLHQAFSDNRVTEAILGLRTGFDVPIATILTAVAVTLAACILAGLQPAVHASRTDVMSAFRAA